VRKAIERCVGALFCWAAAGASQQQRKPGQDTLLTKDKRSSPPATRPVRKLQRGVRNLLLRSLIVLSFVAASCAYTCRDRIATYSYEMAPFLMPLDRDTERSPRTRVLADIAHR
jgi:hypothetical protein